jgi:hypothetical protein
VERKESCREVGGHVREKRARRRDGKPFPSLCSVWALERLCLARRPYHCEIYFTILAFVYDCTVS